MTPDILARFEAKVEPEPNSGCWLWTAADDSTEYGMLAIARRPARAHRLAYEHFVGPIPPDKELHHICRVRRCVNPAHLLAVNRLEHIKHNRRYGRAECPQGHAFEGSNLYVAPDGSRYCRPCRRASAKAFRVKRQTKTTRPNGLKTHCAQGHAFEGENLYRHAVTGWRSCRACRNASIAKHRAKAAKS